MNVQKNEYIRGLEGEKQSAIVFFRSQMIEELADFYRHKLGCSIWHRQPGVVILRFGSFLFGFHHALPVDRDALISFTLETRDSVDRACLVMGSEADGAARMNEKYGIYHFFAKDPEGRKIEFQSFFPTLDLGLSEP